MAQVPTGSTFYIASAYGSAKTVTIVTNATEAVVTAVAHGFSNGDVVEMTSGWGRLNKRHFEIESVLTDSFVLSGEDTTNTTFYPATQGGDPKTVTYKFVESDVEYSINDGFGATSYTMELDADALGSAGYTALKSLTQVQTDTCLKVVTRSGSRVYQPCTVALNESIRMQDGQINRVTCAFNGNNRLTRAS